MNYFNRRDTSERSFLPNNGGRGGPLFSSGRDQRGVFPSAIPDGGQESSYHPSGAGRGQDPSPRPYPSYAGGAGRGQDPRRSYPQHPVDSSVGSYRGGGAVYGYPQDSRVARPTREVDDLPVVTGSHNPYMRMGVDELKHAIAAFANTNCTDATRFDDGFVALVQACKSFNDQYTVDDLMRNLMWTFVNADNRIPNAALERLLTTYTESQVNKIMLANYYLKLTTGHEFETGPGQAFRRFVQTWLRQHDAFEQCAHGKRAVDAGLSSILDESGEGYSYYTGSKAQKTLMALGPRVLWRRCRTILWIPSSTIF